MPLLNANDLLKPKGRLNPDALWPGTDIDTVKSWLTEWLAEGYADPRVIAFSLLPLTGSANAAARAWAYHRAYDDVLQQRHLLPTSIQISDQGSASYPDDQVESIELLAWKARAEFETILAAVLDPDGYAGEMCVR